MARIYLQAKRALLMTHEKIWPIKRLALKYCKLIDFMIIVGHKLLIQQLVL